MARPAFGPTRGQRIGSGDAAGRTRRFTAIARLEALSREWIEVPAIDDVRTHASRLLRTHALRAADALQLASVIVASDFEPSALAFVSLDARLSAAAEREGFPVMS